VPECEVEAEAEAEAFLLLQGRLQGRHQGLLGRTAVNKVE